MDGLVLGCTHYAFVAAELTALVGAQTSLIEGGVSVARQTRRLLDQYPAGALHQSPDSPPAPLPLFYSTGNLSLLDSAVQRYLHLKGKAQELHLS
jgi:glutamate racemase